MAVTFPAVSMRIPTVSSHCTPLRLSIGGTWRRMSSAVQPERHLGFTVYGVNENVVSSGTGAGIGTPSAIPPSTPSPLKSSSCTFSPGGGMSGGTMTGVASVWKPLASTSGGGGASGSGGGGGGGGTSSVTSMIVTSSASSATSSPTAIVAQIRPAATAAWSAIDVTIVAASRLPRRGGLLARSRNIDSDLPLGWGSWSIPVSLEACLFNRFRSPPYKPRRESYEVIPVKVPIGCASTSGWRRTGGRGG